MDEVVRSTMCVRAYDPLAVAELLGLADTERTRLRAALAGAEHRVSVARLRLVAAQETRERVAAMVIEAERRHRERDDEVAGAVRLMLQAADAESTAMTAAAQADVARRQLASSIGRVSEAAEAPALPVRDLAGPPVIQVF